MKKKQESGRSMVEMVGVLAVMGLITAGAFVLINSGLKTQKRSSATDEIDVIAANVRAMVAQSENKDTPYSGLPANCTGNTATTAKSLAAGLLGSDNSTVTSAYGTGTTYAVCRGDNDGKTFAVALSGIKAGECQALATRSYSHGSGACATGTGNNPNVVTITFTE